MSLVSETLGILRTERENKVARASPVLARLLFAPLRLRFQVDEISGEFGSGRKNFGAIENVRHICNLLYDEHK